MKTSGIKFTNKNSVVYTLTLVLLVLVFISNMAKAQTITNGDFEQWQFGHPNNWTSYDFLDISQSTDKANGTYAAKMKDATGDAHSHFTVTTTLKQGEHPTYLACFFKFGNYSPLDAARIRVFFVDENGAQTVVVNQKIQTHVTDYTALTMSFDPMAYYFVPEPKKIKIEVVFDSNVSQPGEFYIDNLMYDGITGMNELEADQLTIYPNPNEGNFKINNKNNSIVSVAVFNVKGEKVYESKSNTFSSEVEMNLANCPKGIYYVQCQYEQNVQTQKIILQ